MERRSSARRQRDQAKRRSEESTPYDHPWRAAQAMAYEASEPARLLSEVLPAVLYATQDLGREGREPLLQRHQQVMALIDRSQQGVAAAFRTGLLLLRGEGFSEPELVEITGLNYPQIKYLRSPKASRTFDPLQGSPERLPAPDYYADDEPERAPWLDLTNAHEAARRYVTMRLAGKFGAEEQVHEFFRHLRHGAQQLTDIEYLFLSTLRNERYSWAAIGHIVHISAQGAWRRYSKELDRRMGY